MTSLAEAPAADIAVEMAPTQPPRRPPPRSPHLLATDPAPVLTWDTAGPGWGTPPVCGQLLRAFRQASPRATLPLVDGFTGYPRVIGSHFGVWDLDRFGRLIFFDAEGNFMFQRYTYGADICLGSREMPLERVEKLLADCLTILGQAEAPALPAWSEVSSESS